MYQVGVFAFAFYTNLEFAVVMILLERKRPILSYAVDIVHRTSVPFAFVFLSTGLFEQNAQSQLGYVVTGIVLSVLAIVGTIVYLRVVYLRTGTIYRTIPDNTGTKSVLGEQKRLSIEKTGTVEPEEA